jgi:hypothetical protein
MENPLTQEGKASSAVAQAFPHFQLIHFSLDSSGVLGQRQPSCHCFFVSYHSSNKSLELADLAGSHAAEPSVTLFSSTCAHHVGELLNQFICLIHLDGQRPKQGQRFVFFSLQFFGAAKEKDHRLPCKDRRTWKVLRSRLLLLSCWKGTSTALLAPCWKGTSKPPIH